jgi:peptide/nickel transport system substrate-binding protein
MPYRPLCCNLILLCICLVVFACLSCGRGDGLAKDDTSTITILYPGSEEYLSPLYDWDLRFLVFLPLVSYDQNGEMYGRLAKSWEHSHDYSTWTIHLGKDIRWHDGVPVTAHDIKFTLDLVSHPDVHRISPGVHSITVLDDHTYEITHHNAKEDYTSMDDWAVYYPNHLLEHLDPKNIWSWEFWTKPVGNGPYRYVRHIPKIMLELEANPDYYWGKPRIEHAILKFGSSVVPELLSGNVDAAMYVNRLDALTLRNDTRFREYHQTSYQCGGIYWNQKHEKFRDPRVRRALTMAINRKELHQVINLPDNLPIFDVIHTMRQYLRGELPKPLPYDPEQASQLLDKAGWRDKDGNGVRELGDEEFSFTAIVPAGNEAEAIYVQDQFRRVGIRMEIQSLEYYLSIARRRRGDFEAAFHYIRRYSVARGFIGEDSPMGYNNQRIVELLDATGNTFSPDEWDRIYREIWPLFQKDLPVTFLYPNYQECHVVHRKIRGLTSGYMFRANPVLNMENLWIEEEKP